MYVDSSTAKVNGKIYTRHLLRESYREGGKVKHRTIANISRCSPEEIEAIRLALRHKADLAKAIAIKKSLTMSQGQSVGAVWTVYQIARRLGIDQALGDSRQGRLALWQVIARVIDQGSRLSAVRLAGSHAACDVLDLDAFNEDDLYENLDWLCENQDAIENRMFRKRAVDNASPDIFLYDVTSSYLEGTQNELSAFGYNRDGKRGKRQIVIGLLCDGLGEPLSIEVFRGNTSDPKTFASQISKAAERFGARGVTFVGDRGMIKSGQIEALGQEGFHYITAITKTQIHTLLQDGVIQLNMFDQDLAEVETDSGPRYILRRNPARAEEIAASRADKTAALRREIDKRNQYLSEHPRASVAVALREVHRRAEQLRITGWATVAGDEENRRIALSIDEAVLAEEAQLDGCYALKTDLSPKAASKEIVHGRYKDLALIEQAFRTSKTVELELRPVNVRLETRTRGHAFVVMLAYRIARELSRCWRNLNVTVQEGIDELSGLCSTQLSGGGKVLCQQIPKPRPSTEALLAASDVRMPEALPSKGVKVTTKRNLPERRITH